MAAERLPLRIHRPCLGWNLLLSGSVDPSLKSEAINSNVSRFSLADVGALKGTTASLSVERAKPGLRTMVASLFADTPLCVVNRHVEKSRSPSSLMKDFDEEGAAWARGLAAKFCPKADGAFAAVASNAGGESRTVCCYMDSGQWQTRDDIQRFHGWFALLLEARPPYACSARVLFRLAFLSFDDAKRCGTQEGRFVGVSHPHVTPVMAGGHVTSSSISSISTSPTCALDRRTDKLTAMILEKKTRVLTCTEKA